MVAEPGALSVPFELTHVRYAPGDHLGYLLALVSLTPLAAIVGLATLVAVRRDVRTISFLTGLLANEVLSNVLKRIIRQPRPPGGLASDSGHGTGHGMPSSHSQFMAFFAVYLCLALFFRFKGRPRLLAALEATATLVSTGLVAWSRLYLSYHTLDQVLVGLGLGAVVGLFWYGVVDGWIDQLGIFRSRLAQMLLIRDYGPVPNIVQFEYDNVNRFATTNKAKSR